MSHSALRIIEDIDQTPRTVICLVEDSVSGQRYAFKRLRNPLPNPYELARLRQEYSTLQDLDSDRIIKVKDWERLGEHYGILMEFVPASNLQRYLASQPKLDLGAKLKVAVEIAKALLDVHQKSIIHRDINPRNILILPESLTIKLIDFSIATQVQFDSLSGESKDKGFEGSLAYMSPEQTGRMNRQVDARSDLYSFGVTFFELLTGSLPFAADDLLGYIHAHIAKKPAPASSLVRELPVVLDRVLHKLLEKNVEDRYQTAKGLLADLENCQRQWTETGDIQDFELGSQDWNEIFTVSPKLYGRERECQQLLKAYDKAADGSFQIVAVAGHSGIGKTSLIKAVDPLIVAHRGFFIKGKFDQFQRNLSLSAVLAAFKDLVAQTLLRPEHEVMRLKQRLDGVLGPLSTVILDLVPDFSVLLHAAGPIPALPAADASRRTLRALMDVLRAYGLENCPVAFFMDDVQWADQASLEFIRELSSLQNLKEVLLILAYRDNEVSVAHPLSLIFDDVEKKCPIRRITIGPLSEADTRLLVGDAVHRHDAASAELAQWIQSQSEGNPFFITEVLKDIAHRNLVTFARDRGHWTWNIQTIISQRSSDNVVQFLLDRINDLPASCTDLLKIASCIGHSFDLKFLAVHTGSTPIRVLEQLIPALNRGLLICVTGDVPVLLNNKDKDLQQIIELRFRHDRIQQAVDSMLKVEDKASIHLQLARMTKSLPQTRRTTMELAAHYFEASSLITDPAERDSMLVALSDAAQVAKLSNAYDSAYRLLNLARQLMPESYWTRQHDLAYRIYSSFFEATFLTSRFQESEPCGLLLLQHCETLQEKIETLYNLCFQYAVQGRAEDSLRLGRQALGLLGVKIPKKPKLYHTAINLMRFRRLLKQTSYENLVNAPEITDPLKRLTLKIMFEMTAVGVNTGEKLLLGFLISRSAEIAIRYGNCPESAYAFVLQASILQIAFNDNEGARRIALTGLAIMEKIPGVALRGRILGCYANFVHSWHLPSSEYAGHVKRALEAAFEDGDLLWIAATGVSVVNATRGLTLQESIREQSKYLLIVRNTKHREFIEFGMEALGYMLCVSGQTATPVSLSFEGFDEQKFEEECEASRYSLNLAFHYMNKVDVQMSQEQWVEARAYLKRMDRHKESLNSLVTVFDYHMYHCLLIAQEAQHGSKAQKFVAATRIAKILRFVNAWADYNPENFEFYRLFLTAIQNNVKDQFSEAAQGFEKALASVRKFKMMRQEALVLQVTFKFHQNRGILTIAKVYLQKLLHVLHVWGAKSRIDFLKKSYPELIDDEGSQMPETYTATLAPARGSQNSLHTMAGQSNLDIDSMSLIKASQVLVGEVRLEALLQKIAVTLLENAGADRAALILGPNAEGRYQVKFVQQAGDSQVLILEQDLETCTNLCQSLVRSVARSGKIAIISDGPAASELKDDPYMRKEKPLSLLCVPMRNQGRLGGVIYLENRITRGAFTSDRKQIVEVLATQAAMSIEKAQLYSHMEQKIEERTRDIRSILANIQQGIFTIKGPQLTVDDDYSIYLETLFERKGLARMSMEQLLFSQSNLDADRKALVKNVLLSSLGEDLLAFELNAAHLPFEMTIHAGGSIKQIEMDWHPISGPDNRVAQILVAVRDVTTLRALQAETTRRQMELERIGELLSQPAPHLIRFFAEAYQLLEECLQTLQRPEMDPALGSLSRSLHTLKGLARGNGLKNLSAAVHHVEDELVQQNGVKGLQDLIASIQSLRKVLDEYQEQFKKLVPALKQDGLDTDDYAALVKDLSKLSQLNLGADMQARIRFWQSRLAGSDASPLDQWLKAYQPKLAEIAGALHKKAPALVVVAPPLHLSESGARTLERILTHLFHNAVDHGLESTEERIKIGKTEQGTLTIVAKIEHERFIMRFEDDGRGLDLDGILAKGQRMGLCSAEERNPDRIAQLIFHPGFSTSKSLTEISGRGVGMNAVEAEIKAAGGSVEIQLLGNPEARFRPFVFVIELPQSEMLDPKDAASERKVS
ncbi:MAG TPA: AAA family ATPase [Oligoflexus sp.]|uniref:protein kinase domain-containing protein n=1 Tax=Oligoflexus sp. TaxID=1971216 RepID=UPI002D807C79|nr:AAA family ATPase [Oligoflexus sp.]HET9240295.1 AAA family ATPase [Oligoflexus sp.]